VVVPPVRYTLAFTTTPASSCRDVGVDLIERMPMDAVSDDLMSLDAGVDGSRQKPEMFRFDAAPVVAQMVDNEVIGYWSAVSGYPGDTVT